MNDQPKLHHVFCPDPGQGHRMAYWQWGQSDSPHVVVCVHGLSRQGRDFDVLARALCERAAAMGRSLRVVCVDIAGRGESDWLDDPAGYQVPGYAADMLVLLAALHASSPVHLLDWVGTSMGGLVGMVVCGQPALPLPVAVRKLVLNDVGPALEGKAIARIGTYLGQAGTFATYAEAADAMWAISSSFGPHTPSEWMALSRHMVRPVSLDANSRLRLHYDPAIALPFKASTEATAAAGAVALWQLYDAITADTLLLRGAESDLLSAATAEQMGQRGPHARLVEFAGVGHAPTLVAANQVETVLAFLFD